ncbi:unnamed protein product [Prunus armeniaca]|uniref:Uncharacterized protein n=1 Tax=Prunus armeniaca TaxID=36596 RepID=A0A6J5XBE1_PRUAR|nr:unnamed protein product [Prunus armeniaca]
MKGEQQRFIAAAHQSFYDQSIHPGAAQAKVGGWKVSGHMLSTKTTLLFLTKCGVTFDGRGSIYGRFLPRKLAMLAARGTSSWLPRKLMLAPADLRKCVQSRSRIRRGVTWVDASLSGVMGIKQGEGAIGERSMGPGVQ